MNTYPGASELAELDIDTQADRCPFCFGALAADGDCPACDRRWNDGTALDGRRLDTQENNR